MKGLFISFEGPDGTGKTTQLKNVAAALRAQGYEVLESREPGGTIMAEKVRNIVLDPELPINNITEVLLFSAARSEHVEKVLAPAVEAGKIVLCDRFPRCRSKNMVSVLVVPFSTLPGSEMAPLAYKYADGHLDDV